MSSNRTAPSSSRRIDVSCRSNLINRFGHCQTFWIEFLCIVVYPFSFTSRDRNGRHCHSRPWCCFATVFPVTLCSTLPIGMVSDFSATYLQFCSQFEPKKLFCLGTEIRPEFRYRNVLDEGRPLHPRLGRSSCFHESNLSHGMFHPFQGPVCFFTWRYRVLST